LKFDPAVGQPIVELADWRACQVGEQLREVHLRVDAVAAAGAGEGAQDCGGLAASFVADEQAVLAVERDPLHLPFTDVVVDRHTTVVGAVGCEDIQFPPLPQRVTDGVTNPQSRLRRA